MVKREKLNARDIVLQKKPVRTFSELAQFYGIGVDELRETARILEQEGYGIESDGDVVIRKSVEPSGKVDLTERFKKGLRFGLISDTHIGSSHARQDALEAIYDVFQKEGIRTTLHCGDVTDGNGVYLGQEQEQVEYGQDAQIDMVIKDYPKRVGMRTAFITGNHDLREYQRGGVDPGIPIERSRPDMEYVGQCDSRLQLTEGGLDIELIHPAKGASYALSYHVQRDLNSRSPDDIPDIYASGHFHNAFYAHYRGVETLSVPCLKDAGMWERRMGFNNVVGGWLVEAETTEDTVQIRRFKPELVTFKKK